MSTPTIGQALDLLAERDPAAPAIDDGRGTLTRAELQSASRRLARLLLGRGLRPDDVVAVRGANDAATVIACCAVWRAGGTPLPLGARLPPAEQAAVVRTASAVLVLGARSGEFGAVPALPLAPDASACDDGPLTPIAASSWKAMPTSGSTGTPKVVLAAASAHVDPARKAAPFLPLAARHLVAGPIMHAAPFTYAMRGLTTGHALVLLPRFEPQAVLDAIGARRITWTMLVPTMLHRILRLPAALAAADLTSLQQLVHLGAPIAPQVKRRWLELLGPERVTEVYAGTESNGLTVIRGDEWLRRPGSVGRPAAGTEVRVVDAAGHPVPPGVVGRVQLRRAAGPAYRYLGAETPAAGAWDTLGDDGHLDEQGYLFLTDRGGDRIVRGGTSLYPIEVEQVLEQHHAVRSAVVVGVRDDDLGQRIHAVVDVEHAATTASELLAWARPRLDPAKRIDSLRVVREPLRDDAGKVRRAAHLPAPLVEPAR